MQHRAARGALGSTNSRPTLACRRSLQILDGISELFRGLERSRRGNRGETSAPDGPRKPPLAIETNSPNPSPWGSLGSGRNRAGEIVFGFLAGSGVGEPLLVEAISGPHPLPKIDIPLPKSATSITENRRSMTEISSITENRHSITENRHSITENRHSITEISQLHYRNQPPPLPKSATP